MKKSTTPALAILLLAVSVAEAADVPSRHTVSAGVDLSIVRASGLQPWTEGFVGKLRYDDASDGAMISRAFIAYENRLADTLELRTTAEFYADDVGAPVDFTEAYIEWRPVPRTPTRYRLKVGAFYPRLSLENTVTAWSSPYTLDLSTINTWVAEELRTIGAEFSISRRPRRLGGNQQLGLQAAVFWNNDPTGSLLVWKGWSAHDRQSRFGDHLPLPPLPQIQPGMMFEAQEPYVAPFREVDNRPGFYVGGEWRYGDRMLVRALHYDDRADPMALEDGQYAWRTRFDHVGAQLSLPAGFGLVSQWIHGSTVMGPVMNGAHVADAGFDSKFLLLTRSMDKHRLSLRYDNFDVTENDQTPVDDNSEEGIAWTASYRYAHSDRISLAAEWLSIKTHRPAWAYYGLAATDTETQLRFSLMLRFSN